MHGKIDRSLHERGIDLGREELLALDGGERAILDPIAAGLDANELDRETCVELFEPEGHRSALSACQRGSARAELQYARPHGSNGVKGREIFPAVRMRGIGAQSTQ